jgi:phosphoglycerate kinase
MKCIDEVPASELKGKRVLVRAGLDLSLDNQGNVSDLFRVKKACPTLEYLQKAGARTIILSHIGRDPSSTNAPVAKALSEFLKVSYVPDLFGPMAKDAVDAMREGDILLLENLRQHYDLEKAKDETFAKNLASLGEIYVDDAFSNAHRDHASMTLTPKYLSHYAGFLLRDEVQHLEKALHPPRPALVIVGGTKFETKDPIIRSFLNVYDHAFVVGAIANDILRSRGLPVGRSKISEHAPEKEVATHPHLIALTDVTVEGPDGQSRVKKVENVEAGDKIVDIGPDSVAAVAPFIQQAAFILWNGPTGVYESGYISYTQQIAQMIAGAAGRGAQAVIGGGDTLAAIEAAGVPAESLGFLSTGGGAMLEYLLKGTLPGIAALK